MHLTNGKKGRLIYDNNRLFILINRKLYYYPQYIYELKTGKKLRPNETVASLDSDQSNTSLDNLYPIDKRLLRRIKLRLGHIFGQKSNPFNHKSAKSYDTHGLSKEQLKILFFATLLKVKAAMAKNSLGRQIAFEQGQEEREALIIKLHKQGKTLNEIENLLNMGTKTATMVITRWEDGYYGSNPLFD